MTIKQIFKDNDLHIQETSYTCGPASILNVLSLKGIHTFSEAELTKLCETKPNFGVSNEDMIKTIKHVGLEIIEERTNASIDDLKRNLDMKAIIIVNYFDPFSNEGHYAVVTEYDEQALYLHDSWFGLLRLSIKRFGPVWHNGNDTIRGWYVAVT
jgi:predicted double-glycine peptidase